MFILLGVAERIFQQTVLHKSLYRSYQNTSVHLNEDVFTVLNILKKESRSWPFIAAPLNITIVQVGEIFSELYKNLYNII